MVHKRCIFPVGQGGFAVEKIGDFVIAFDCGSSTSVGIVESCIDLLLRQVDKVDVLFISHFDKDHVNSIAYLLKKVKVVKAITAMIPDELKTAYGIYTNGAYGAIMNLLTENGVETDRVGEEGQTYTDLSSIWEWIAKSMMTNAEFTQIKSQLHRMGLDVTRMNDAHYMEREKENVNNAFKEVFGAKGPNAKGLIVLSQKTGNVVTRGCDLYIGCCHSFQPKECHEESSCLYVGDADLRNWNSKAFVQAFLQRRRTGKVLLLMQIPHHGSQYNRGTHFETDFPSILYFVNDVDTKRLQNNPELLTSLKLQNKLLVASDRCRDMIVGITRI